tara:strand:- start:5882 stop:6058 length:177 start_codon:yes stop_codon:yes gene_type:complete
MFFPEIEIEYKNFFYYVKMAEDKSGYIIDNGFNNIQVGLDEDLIGFIRTNHNELILGG